MKTFIMNLTERVDRKEHSLSQFKNRKEFELEIVPSVKNKTGAMGLWTTIRQIIQKEVTGHDPFIIICEDDHKFTENYSEELLTKSISEASNLHADILLGGISGFQTCIPVSENLHWIEIFSGMQFSIIFRRFFPQILATDFTKHDRSDFKISALSINKFLIFPFISIQEEFGYSDVTEKNNRSGRVSRLFKESSHSIDLLRSVSLFYKDKRNTTPYLDVKPEDLNITTYIINLKERKDRKIHIQEQFAGKPEFDIKYIDAVKHQIGAVGLWLNIKKAVAAGLKNDEDVILICEDDHQFTEAYDKKMFFSNILEAHSMGCNLLIGGVGGGFDHILPVSENMFWVNSFWCMQFIIIYKELFTAILGEPFSDTDTADGIFSHLTSKKLVLFPFISTQKEFGYSDVTFKNNTRGNIRKLFETADSRFKSVSENFCKKYLRFASA